MLRSVRSTIPEELSHSPETGALGGPQPIDVERRQRQPLLVASVHVGGEVAQLRGVVRELLLPNQRSIHMKNERDSRKRQIAAALVAAGVQARVYRAGQGCRGSRLCTGEATARRCRPAWSSTGFGATEVCSSATTTVGRVNKPSSPNHARATTMRGCSPVTSPAAEATGFFYAADAVCRASPALRMLRAACSSAGAVWPQRWQTNSA